MIELFCGIELKDVIKIKASDISDMVQHFNQLFSGKQNFQHRFKIGDLEFGFVTDLENISWGEYIDIERNLTSWDTMHKAMAAMYRPITKRKGEKYEIETANRKSINLGKLDISNLDTYLKNLTLFSKM